jgi:hypothetical protein
MDIYNDVPQYAHFLPKYFPIYGTTTMVNNSSICCSDSLHSLSASDMNSSSSADETVAEDGRESISSASEELMAWSMKLSLLLMAMARSREAVDSWVLLWAHQWAGTVLSRSARLHSRHGEAAVATANERRWGLAANSRETKSWQT